MNQVTEMLRLAPGAVEAEAVARLSSLFEMMSITKGFQSAEILHRLDEPDLLLVLHAWDDISDWQAFQSSEQKLAFSATRPAALYSFVPCGMNWRGESGGAVNQDGAVLRREVFRGHVEPARADEAVASHTFAYQDYEPELADASMRLTRLSAAPSGLRTADATVIADEVYESVYSYVPVSSREQVQAG